MTSRVGRPGSVAALLVTAVVSGALAGLLTACFIWLVESGIHFIWGTVPTALGLQPTRSWWLFAIPIAAGLLVGLGQRLLGNYPTPLGEVIAAWRAGERIDPKTLPATAFNSLAALLGGGPVGFEAALTGLVGGSASWVGDRIASVGHLVRQAWGAERIDALPRVVRTVPYWLAAISGMLTYRNLPFGEINFGFRYDDFTGTVGLVEVLAIFVFGFCVCIPTAWMAFGVVRAEHSRRYRRSPELFGMAGGALVALLALGNEHVLFSGQESIEHLAEVSTAGLLYLTAAKWLALVVALLAGWRGGPIFPLYLVVAALATASDRAVGIGPDLLVVGGVAAVSLVFVRGNVAAAFVLSLYVAPFSYTGVILIGALGAAVALALGGALGWLPRPKTAAGPGTSAVPGPTERNDSRPSEAS